MCQSMKVPFATLRGAAMAAREALNKYGPQRPYECECGRYHLTTKGLHGAPLTEQMVEALCEAVAA